MRTDKTTLFIKWYCQRAIACSHLQNGVLLSVIINNKLNYGSCITFPLIFWDCRNVLDFKYVIFFIGYDTLALDPIIIKYIHLTVIKITVNHIFLLIC